MLQLLCALMRSAQHRCQKPTDPFALALHSQAHNCVTLCQGKANKESVVRHTLQQFTAKFSFFVANIARMDALFDVNFSPLSASGAWQLPPSCSHLDRGLLPDSAVPAVMLQTAAGASRAALSLMRCDASMHAAHRILVQLYMP